MLIYKLRSKLNIVELTIVDTGVVEIGGFIFYVDFERGLATIKTIQRGQYLRENIV
jgi:hypothetical protein